MSAVVATASGVSWARARGWRATLWLLVPGVAFMLAFVVYPLCYGVGLSFQAPGGMFAAYQKFFDDPYLRNSVWITLALSLPAALICVAGAVPLSYRMRGPLRGKRTLTAVIMVPMTLGSVFVADGMIDFLGPGGWFNRTLLAVHLISRPLVLIHNFTGVLLSMVISGFPLAFLLVLGYFSGLDPHLEQAAATLGARPWQRFRLVLFPLLLPGLTITFALSFVLAFAVFPSATLVGDPAGSTRVISIVAYTAYSQADYPSASAIAVVMGVVELVVLGVVFLIRGRLYRGPSGGGKG
ncbi:MAG TPA: ABC transporter permease subunit [Pseudonocardiaceae bacterium]|nr:ABC transporter permease subunit [Pseudonocardiaceae bacterium]